MLPSKKTKLIISELVPKTIQFDDETFFVTYNNDDENQNNNI